MFKKFTRLNHETQFYAVIKRSFKPSSVFYSFIVSTKRYF